MAQTKKKKIAIKSAKVELNGDFKGYWIRIRTNPKLRQLNQAASLSRDSTFEEVVEALAPFVIDWNLVDEDGNELKAPKGDPDSLMELTQDLFEVVSGGIRDKIFRTEEEEAKNSNGA